MRLLMLGVPHVRPIASMTSCAFGTKTRRWGKMMAPLGYECIYLGVGEPDLPGYASCVPILTVDEQCALLGYDPADSGSQFIGRDANIGHPLYVEFNKRLKVWLEANVGGDDIICLPFGHGHAAALSDRTRPYAIETGIGYPDQVVGWRIYESAAWMHWHLGKLQRAPFVSEWIVPNYFDAEEWPARTAPLNEGYVLYMGRLVGVKGLNVVLQMALRRPELEFVICGQGDPSPWLHAPNLRYHEPVHGMERAKLIHGARCTLMPSEMVEPFGGVSIESMLTGTPCITSDHSAFRENIPAHLRCHTINDYLLALDLAATMDAASIRTNALTRWSLEAVGPMYHKIFQQVPLLRQYGFDMGPPVEIPQLQEA